MVIVPVRLLHKFRDYEYNPFEPNNQTALYHELSAMIAAQETSDGNQARD